MARIRAEVTKLRKEVRFGPQRDPDQGSDQLDDPVARHTTVERELGHRGSIACIELVHGMTDHLVHREPRVQDLERVSTIPLRVGRPVEMALRIRIEARGVASFIRGEVARDLCEDGLRRVTSPDV